MVALNRVCLKNRCDGLLSRQSRSVNVPQFVRVRDDKIPAGMANSSCALEKQLRTRCTM